jgi:hypothetical protein
MRVRRRGDGGEIGEAGWEWGVERWRVEERGMTWHAVRGKCIVERIFKELFFRCIFLKLSLYFKKIL